MGESTIDQAIGLLAHALEEEGLSLTIRDQPVTAEDIRGASLETFGIRRPTPEDTQGQRSGEDRSEMPWPFELAPWDYQAGTFALELNDEAIGQMADDYDGETPEQVVAKAHAIVDRIRAEARAANDNEWVDNLVQLKRAWDKGRKAAITKAVSEARAEWEAEHAEKWGRIEQLADDVVAAIGDSTIEERLDRARAEGRQEGFDEGKRAAFRVAIETPVDGLCGMAAAAFVSERIAKLRGRPTTEGGSDAD